MEDEECAKMFIHLQQYVPHLEKLISQLKDPKKENRELQLNKLEGLYSMITDKKKKLKLDTLRKCEDVILKILQKVNPNIVRQLKPFIPLNDSPMIKICDLKEDIMVEPVHDQKYFDSLKFQAARARLNVISTPASPSPPKDSIPLVHLPIVIPTEKVKSPPDPHLLSINNWIIPLTRKESNFASIVDSLTYKTEKPDIYNKAAATLNSSPKAMVFDRLGSKVDMSKPPLSEEDLQQLTTPTREVYYEDQNLEDLEDLREKLQKKILKTENKLHLPDLRTKLLNKDKLLPLINIDELQPLNKGIPLVLNKEMSLAINKEIPLAINKEIPLVINKEIPLLVNKEKPQVLNQEKSPPPQIKHKESEVFKSKPSKDPETQKIRDPKSSEKSSSKKVDTKPSEEKQKKDDKSSSSKTKTPKVEKIIKDPNTQFGSLLSSIDEKILGDKKKDSSKRETSVKGDKSKGDKKDSTKKDSHEKKDKDNKKSEEGSKKKEHHKSKSRDHSKNSPRNHSKEKDSEKHKSSHSDKSKESNSKHSSKSSDKSSSSSVKSTENSSAKSHNSDAKDSYTFKRLADKYNPRPRKNSVEDILKSPVGDVKTTILSSPPTDPGSVATNVSRDPRSTAHLKDPRSANQRVADPRNAMHVVGDPRSAVHVVGDPRSAGHAIGDPRSAGHPVGDPRSAVHSVGDHRVTGYPIGDRRATGHPTADIRNNIHQIGVGQNFPNNYNANKNFYEPPINNDPYHFNKSQNQMEHNSIATGVGNMHHRALLPTPSHPMQMGFQTNNTMIRQNEFIQNTNQFIPPQQRLVVNQNVLHQGNSFSNIYYKSNSNQMNNPVNIPYQSPSKAFHPYEPIESSEYDLSKMQPVDFYSPTVTQPVNQLTSPPTYGNRNFAQQPARVERREDTFRSGREQNQRLQNDPRKEEVSKLASSRDPRIRSREMKERSNNTTIPPKGTSAAAQPKSTTGESHNKYDSLYSKLVDRKVPEMFTSPLDSLYSNSEPTKTTSSLKGYGFQRFKIPKKKADLNKKTKESKIDQKEDSYKHDDKLSDTKEPSSDDEYEVESEVKKPEEEKPVAHTEPEVIEPSPSDPKLITEFVTQMIQSSDKQKLLSTLLSSLEDSITEKQKQAMKRIKKAIDCDDAEEDVSRSEVDTPNDDKDVSSTTEETLKESEQETKTISKESVLLDLENDDVEVKEEDKAEEEDSFDESDDEDKIKPKKITKRLINTRSTKKLRKNKKRGAKKIEDLNSSFEDNVVETVSEKTKGQRRITKTADGKPRKCRTELDMLHEDIKEMFIRDGVLTANGKRMCTMLKGDKSDSEGVSSTPLVKDKNISKVAEAEEISLDSPKRRARESNPKVLIEKTDLSKLPTQSLDESDSESEDGRIPQRRTRSSLKNKLAKRNTRSRTSYKEDTSDDENKLDSSKITTTTVLDEAKGSEELKASEDESKASEDESKASEEVAVDDPETIASNQVQNKRNKRKRRGYNWAAGIIQKRPKKAIRATSRPVTPHLEDEQPPSEPEEIEVDNSESLEIEYTEPDKNYYFDPQMKPDCKLCSFKGRMIIQHYRSNHPKHEVLISRLSPDIAEAAINESKTKNYNEFEIPAEASQPKFRRNKYTFQCRFCQVFLKNETTDTFFDHLTSHTGEYRFLCQFCPFKTANSKSVRSHMHSSHNATSEQTGTITPIYPSPPDFNTLFGYICAECNFVQMTKSAMERHSKIIHVGDFSKICKISMSMIPSKNPTVDEDFEQSKNKGMEIEEADPVQNVLPEESAPVVDEKPIAEVKTSENDENLNLEIAEPQEPEELKTAFTITDDQEGEIEKCKETKQEKMEEIQKTIIPKKRLTSNLLEELKNRLNDKIDVAVKKDDIKNLEPKEKNRVKRVEDGEQKTSASVSEPSEIISGPSTSKSEQIVQPKEIPVENDLVKKGLLDKRENRNKLDGITNIIERLQDKLLADSQKLPPLIPIEEFNSQDLDFTPEEVLALVGPLITGKKKNIIYYVCNVKSCMFSSRNPADFKTHCTTLHSNDPWDGYCSSCDKKTNYNTAIGAYIHLVDVHMPKEIAAKAKLIKEEPEKAKPYLRTRRLSGDKLSEKSEMLIPPVVIKKEDPDIEIIDDSPAEDEPFNFPFQITNVTSLADEEEEEDEKKWETSDAPSPNNNTSNGPTIGIVLPMLSSIKGSSPVPAITKPASPRQLISARTPVFTVTSPQKIQSKKILLKDTPLQLDELVKPRKNKSALHALLSESKLRHLYKCPEYACSYSTDIKKHFEMHLKQHGEYTSGMQIPCLYCNFKTSFNLIGIHYDIRHSKCLYCCAYCFYRAVNQSYVEIHQEHEHSAKVRRVIVVPQNLDALMSQANIAIPHIKNVLTPYSCGQLGCEEKFIFETDFKRHLATVHKGIPLLCVCCPHSPVNEEAAVIHAQVHNVFYYNCRYCVFGSIDIDDVHKHLSQIHFALAPQIILRQYQDKGTGKLSSDFNYNDDAIFDHVLVQGNENFNYITPVARVYSTVSTPSTQSIVKITQKNSTAETITLYKAPAPSSGVPIKYLKCASNSKLKDVELKKISTDNEIVQVSDDDDEDDNKPVLSKSPIVLNNLIAQGKGILSLTNSKVATETPKPEPVRNFIDIQDFSQNNSMSVTFGPDQIDQLPIRPIFNQNIVCSVCGYESKVRANLVRHLQFHLQNKEVPVPVSAPVNPVPCLDKNEKMFDKMTNLAHSSFSDKSRMSGPSVKREMSYITKEEESNFPKFVPSAKRYVCGAYNCQYLNQEESILRNHVQTFHSDETSYMCLHCNESLTIDKLVINVENILHHLKLHDLNLYKCKYCPFLHYQKQKIEAHVAEKHLSDRLHIVVVREMEQEPQNSLQVEEVKEKKPWRCGICKYRCTTKSEIVSHAFNKHEVENQYNCAMCSFKSNERNVFETHFRVNHIGHRVDVNSTYYEVMESPVAMKPTETEVFDTTPLWQRDKNKFKHIRGIPLDESIKVPKKSPFKAAPVYDNLDKSIEAVANGSATAVPKTLKSAMAKKPKTLKEKRMKEDNARAEGLDELDMEVMGLEVDESPLQLPKNPLQVKDPFTIIYNGKETIKELSIKDIEEMDLNMIKLGEFSCESGKFGKPANKEYFCPICENFKTKRVIEFTQHLYKDLNYDRFVCTRCGLSNASSKVLEKHSIKRHPMASLEIHTLPPDIKLEQFVNKLIAYQQRVMFANGQPETVERKRESNAYGEFKNLEKCKHCSYTSKYCGDLKKHETRHWAVKPYKCAVCSFEGVTSSEVIQHSRRIHVNRPPDVITVQLPENPKIIPISRKRRYPHKVESDASSDAFEFNENSSDMVLPDNSDGDHGNDDIVYVCHYCPKRGTNESEIKDHWEVVHKPKSMIFKVKKMKRSDLIKPSSVLYYKCGYCDLRTQFDNIRKHCKDAHPEMTFSAFRFKCGIKECSEYLKSYDHAKSHFNASHPGSKINYIDIPKLAATALQITCEFCSLIFDSREKFSLHQKDMHSHLVLSTLSSEVPRPPSAGLEASKYKCPECNHLSCNYAAMRDHVRSHAKPFVCLHCSQRFLYPSVVKTHHNREHRDLEFKYECDDVAMKRNDFLRSNILVLTKDGTYVKNKNSKSMKRSLPSSTEVNCDSTELPEPLPLAKKFKATARKSTTKQSLVNNSPVEEGYSYYGCKPDFEDTENVKASLPFLNTTVKFLLKDLTFANIFPVVEVEDYQKKLKV